MPAELTCWGSTLTAAGPRPPRERWHAAAAELLACAVSSARTALPLLLRSSAYREAARDFRAAAAEDRALRSALGRQLIAFEHLLDDQQRAAFARSLKGRMYNVLGYVFSVYCVYKVPTQRLEPMTSRSDL